MGFGSTSAFAPVPVHVCLRARAISDQVWVPQNPGQVQSVSQEAPALIRGLVQDPTVPPRADPAARNEEAEVESVPYPEEEVAEVKAAEEEVAQVKAEEEKVAEDELPTVPYVADSPADSGEEVEELGTDDWPSWYEGMGEEEEALSSSSSSSTREQPQGLSSQSAAAGAVAGAARVLGL